MKDQYNHKYDDIINCRIPSKEAPSYVTLCQEQHSFRLLHLPDTEAAIKTVRQTDAKQVLSEEVIAELNKSYI